MKEAMLSAEAMRQLEERLSALAKAGVQASDEKSGELNMSGCATGYCMAWD